MNRTRPQTHRPGACLTNRAKLDFTAFIHIKAAACGQFDSHAQTSGARDGWHRVLNDAELPIFAAIRFGRSSKSCSQMSKPFTTTFRVKEKFNYRERVGRTLHGIIVSTWSAKEIRGHIVMQKSEKGAGQLASCTKLVTASRSHEVPRVVHKAKHIIAPLFLPLNHPSPNKIGSGRRRARQEKRKEVCLGALFARTAVISTSV